MGTINKGRGFFKDIIDNIGDIGGSIGDIGGSVIDGTVGNIPLLGDILDTDGDGKISDDLGSVVGSTIGSVIGAEFGGPGGALVGGQLGGSAGGAVQDFVGNFVGGGGGSGGGGNSNQQVSCTPLSCYQKCQMQDKQKIQECRAMNARFAEEMKKRGCPGTKCHTPSLAKACRKTVKRKRPSCAKRALPCARRVPKGRCAAKSACGCS